LNYDVGRILAKKEFEMAKIVIVEYTYIFYCDGEFFEQNIFASDEDAIKHAKLEAEKRGKPVKVARWLEF
jgi:hypothetical protein